MKDEIKIRKSFPKDFDPNTKIHKVKSDYQRSSNKKEIQKALEEAESDFAADLSEWEDL